MDSDSSYYETTYSQDERIEKSIKKKKDIEQEEVRQFELERAKAFSKCYETGKNTKKSIFNLKGIQFIKFTSKKIKFTFEPWRVAKVTRRAIFYISLRHRKGFWILKRDTIPVNYKLKVYALFYTKNSFRYRDDDIARTVSDIWAILVKWSKREEKFRAKKFMRYRNGDEDVYIDEDDEDLFLSEDEIRELHAKREKIWNRMLPPSPRPLKFSTSEESS